MKRVTEKDLENIVARINELTGSPDRMLAERAADGSMRYNVGNYHLANEYGGVRLERVANEKGGVQDAFNQGYMTRRELRNCMWAWIEGRHTGKESVKLPEGFTVQPSDVAHVRHAIDYAVSNSHVSDRIRARLQAVRDDMLLAQLNA